MKLDKKRLSKELRMLDQEEGIVIEKHEGTFAVNKNYSQLVDVHAVIDLENGKVKANSHMGLLTMALIVISIMTIWGFLIVLGLYFFYIRPQYENELKGRLKGIVEKTRR